MTQKEERALIKNTMPYKEVELDPVQVEIFYNRLYKCLEESKDVLMKTSASPVSRDCGEVVVGFYAPDAEAVLMAAGIFVHITTATRAIRYMIRNKYEEDIGIYEGDVFVNNDPHIGGMHSCDFLLISPVFYEGKLVGWTSAFSHHPEVGAIDPGGVCPRATERFHEGLQLPCVKIVERGKPRRDIMQMMSMSVRDARTLDLEVRAKIGANVRASRLVRELIDEVGVDFFMTVIEKLVDEAEAQARDRLKEFKPGVYRARRFMDATGGYEERLMMIECSLEITDDGRAIFRTPVIGRETKGISNIALPGTEGMIFSVALTQVFYDCRWNTGIFKRFSLDIPDGTQISCGPTTPVGFSACSPGMELMNMMNTIFSTVQFISKRYEDILAPMPVGGVLVGGGIDQFGRTTAGVILDITAMGMGARFDRDGVNTGAAHWSVNSDCADAESWEQQLPLLYLCRNEVPDTGGFGKYRGGVGFDTVVMASKSPQFVLGSLGSGRHVTKTSGLWGAYPACCGRVEVVQNTDLFERIKEGKPIPHLMEELLDDSFITGDRYYLNPMAAPRPMKDGDIYSYRNVGGGGIGDPIERDPELVARDLRNGYTSLRTAEKVYCVAVDPLTFEVDYRKTEQMRKAKKKERLAQGKPAREYLKEMVKKREDRDLPEPVLQLFDDLIPYSQGFMAELDFEKKFSSKPSANGKQPVGQTKVFLNVTPYINIIEDEYGEKFSACRVCGHIYAKANENFKLYSLIYERDPKEIQPGRLGPDKDWMIYREFYCPGCGIQFDVEATAPGTPILHDIEIKL